MGEMAAGIAHELHQPLMAITNFANGTRLRLESGHFEVSDLIQVSRKINDEALRAGEITRRIKQFLRKHDPQFGPVDIDQVISDAVELARISPNARGIRIPVERPEQPIRVWGDTTQLTQVVVNLLLNAMDALSHQTGSWRTASVVIRVLGKTVEIAVMDNGPGIDPENLGRVFDQFFTTKPEGLGLGLAISRSIVQSHGGMISVQSSRHDGTTFTVSLPIDTASPEPT
jgi:C4-dicarboxylate-specific signal transduction histidine kinase